MGLACSSVSSHAYGAKSVAAVVVVWAAVVVAGVRWTLTYERTPGPSGSSPDRWPSSSSLTRADRGFTLLMLAHPDCPCTRASLAELEKIITRTSKQVAAFVLFSKPGTRREDVERSDLWRWAAALPGVTAVFDAGAAETARFRAYVSGHTLLYDEAGRLRFSGGITAVRGQQGDNAGVEAIVRLATGPDERRSTTPVFGCVLHDPDAGTLRERDTRWTKR
jgi:hypothetical protein